MSSKKLNDDKNNNLILNYYKPIDFPLVRIVYINIMNNNKKIYYFMGNINKDIAIVLKKIQNKEKVLKKDINNLKEIYPNDYYNILKYYKLKNDIMFINNLINFNDTIINIKRKIFIYLSNINDNIFFNPNNILLWIDDDKIKDKILGYYYNNYKYDPNKIFKEKIKIDDSFYDKDLKRKIDRNDIISNNNNILGYYYKKLYPINNIKIKLYYSEDFINYLKKNKLNDDKYINGWLIKYFPYYFKNNIVTCLEKYNNIKKLILFEKNIESEFKNIKKYTELVENISLNNISLQYDMKNINNHYNIFSSNININLFNIYYYIVKNKIINKDIPFIKLQLNSKVYINIDKNIRDIISSEELKKWSGVDKVTKNNVYIRIKMLYKTIILNNKTDNLYFSLRIGNNSNIKLDISYKHIHIITYKDIIEIISKVNSLLDKLNNNIILSDNVTDFKFKHFSIEYKNNILIFNEFTKINLFILNINLKKIVYKKIFTYLSKLNNYFTIINKEKGFFKYIKVNNYLNIDEIFDRINKLFISNYTDDKIIKIIMDEFKQTKNKTILFIKYAKRKHKSYIFDIYNKGVTIKIIDNKIKILGLKSNFIFFNIFKLLMFMIYNIENNLKILILYLKYRIIKYK